MRSILLGVTQEELSDPERVFPFVCKVAHIMLVNDLDHYLADYYAENSSKIFYYDRNLYWKNEFHCIPHYPITEDLVSGKLLSAPNWAILHYAWLDPKRMRERMNKPSKFYAPTEWEQTNRIIKRLPEGLTV